ncbi:acyl-CoA thioesterase [Qipengyuania sediminis]|uniref:acyl-CoA thioesterase n=1 Tax=Qipengyuania sediminis TaxID=1532023 RepID=UPI0010595E91|nr:thioesterase family protein [Qipengyuania sediminis]
MTIAALLEPITGRDGPITLPDAKAWLQGRTLYGGASALLAYTAAVRAHPGLPPLRAAQIAFAGPVGAQFAVRVTVLRAGRNVTQMRSELVVDDAVCLAATFVFGTAREPNALHPAPACEPWPGAPEEREALPSPEALHFIANFELRRAQDESGKGAPLVRRWLRLKDENGLDPVSRLLLIGDTLPPGSMRAMRRPGPLSSINWSLNILDPEAETRDGWWLAESASDHADHGYSSERLRLWDADGRLVMVGMQAAALFG